MTSFGPYGNNLHGTVGTLACPPGSYITGVTGKAGADVNAITGVTCKDIITGGVTSSSASGGAVGGSGGGNPVTVACKNTDGVWGWEVKAQTEVEGLNGWCRPTFPGGSSPSVGFSNEYKAGQWGNQKSLVSVKCPDGSLNQSLTGATSNHNSYLTVFGGTCRDFNNMATISKNPLACCAQMDTSQDCVDVRGKLNCGAVLQNYCSTGSNMFTDTTCTTAVTNGAISANDANTWKLNFCYQGTNFANPLCQSLCTYNTGIDSGATITASGTTGGSSNLKTACNNLYDTACASAPNQSAYGTSICSCHLPWENYPGVAAIDSIAAAPHSPQCYFAQCRSTGYLDKPLTQYSCPSCAQGISVNVKDANDVAVKNISQSCSTATAATVANSSIPMAAAAAAAANPSNTTAPAASAAATATPTANSGTWIVVVVVVIILIALGLSSSAAAAMMLLR